jgi:hypothetical protein
MLTLNEFESWLGTLLAQAGCVKYSVPDLHRDAKQCRDEIYADNIAHGGTAAEPFFDVIIVEGVAVFTFFERDFSVYVFRCDEDALIRDTSPLAMADTVACKSLLAGKIRRVRARTHAKLSQRLLPAGIVVAGQVEIRCSSVQS